MIRRFASTRAYLLPFIAIAALVASQFVPLTNRLGYESAILLNAVILWLGVPYVCGRFTRAHPCSDDADNQATHSAWKQWAWSAALLSAFAAIGLVISLLNSVRVPLCDVRAGIEYWALFALGGIPIHSALAVIVLSVRGGLARAVTFVGLVLASIAASLWYLYWQPPIVVYDLFHGYFAGSIYDESLVDSGLHWLYRSYTILFAIGVVALIDLSRANGKSGARALANAVIGALSLSLCAGILCSNAAEGLRVTRTEIESQLGTRIESEHFTIYASANAFTARDRALLVADHEARFEELANFWGVRPTRKLRSYVYGSKDEKGRLMGGRNTLVAKVWLDEMHIVWPGPGDDLLAHEMSHLFLRPYGDGPLKLPNRLGVIPVMGLVEGSATAAAWGTNTLTPHGWSAAMLQIGKLPEISDSLQASRFWSQPSGVVYTALGSFCRWLVYEYGADAFLDVYGTSDFERVTGQTLSELITDWKVMLRDIPLSDADIEEARYAFDRPSIFQARCPRAGAGWIEKAEAAGQAGDFAAVLTSSGELQRNDLLTGQRFLRLVDVLIQIGDNDEAERMLREFVAEQGPSIAERQRALLKLADLAWMTDNRVAAARWLRDMHAMPISADLQRAVFVREQALQSAPEPAEAIFSYLANDKVDRWLRLVALVSIAERSDSAIASYLSGILLAGRAMYQPAERMLSRAIDEMEGTPVFRRALRERAYHRVVHGERMGCADWRTLADDCGEQTTCAAEASMWLDRCAEDWWPFEELSGARE